jgi:hypothetical protein
MSNKKFDNIPDLWKNRRLAFWVSFAMVILSWFLQVFCGFVIPVVYLYIFGGVVGLYFITAIIYDIKPTIKHLALKYLDKK